jgi:threonine/homoserine/homoserine lactone efflux protein
MSLSSLLSLAFAMLILAASPGPGIFTTVAVSLASGFRPAMRVIIGIVTGDVIYLMFAIFGLTTFVQASGKFFIIVRICGGAYLILLGLKIFFSAPSFESPKQIHWKKSETENFISGLMITLSNPKVILFYCAFLPAFVELSILNRTDIFAIFIVVTAVLISVLTAYAYAASRLRYLFSDRKSVKRMNRSAGGIMIAAGIVIVAET